MRNWIIRLDDASEYMNIASWLRIEKLLDKYGIKPIFGIIPDNQDSMLISVYEKVPDFWELMHLWIKKGWIPAMHGYQHKYETKDGGINPVNSRSEFAGLPYEDQARKIREGYHILVEHEITPRIFFAPSHTFDHFTLEALKNETPIRIISDTIAWDIYKKDVFYFVPQQSGKPRKLPFQTITFCVHPNTMDEAEFGQLENFLKQYQGFFKGANDFEKKRNYSLADLILKILYFEMRKIRNRIGK